MKQKVKIKKFVGVNRLLEKLKLKDLKLKVPKGTIKNYNVIISGKSFYNQPADSDIKRYEEIKRI